LIKIIQKYNSFIEELKIPFYTFHSFSYRAKHSNGLEFSEPEKLIRRLRMEGVNDISRSSNRIDFTVPRLSGIVELQIMMWIKSGFIEISHEDVVIYNIAIRPNFINQWIIVSIFFSFGGIYGFLLVQFIWILRLFGLYLKHYILFKKLLRFIE